MAAIDDGTRDLAASVLSYHVCFLRPNGVVIFLQYKARLLLVSHKNCSPFGSMEFVIRRALSVFGLPRSACSRPIGEQTLSTVVVVALTPKFAFLGPISNPASM